MIRRPSLFFIMLVLGAALSLTAAPAPAPVVGQPAAGQAATAPAGCGKVLALPLTTTQGEICPAAVPAPQPTAPPFFHKTCRCSCGYPCTTDADCDGGICSAGITCC